MYWKQFLLFKVSKVGDRSRGWPEGSLFNSYYTEVLGRALLLSLDCSTLPSIRTLYCWVLSKEVSSTILKDFGMTRPGIEPMSPGPFSFYFVYLHYYQKNEYTEDKFFKWKKQFPSKSNIPGFYFILISGTKCVLSKRISSLDIIYYQTLIAEALTAPLQKGKTPPQRVSWYDSKQSNGEVTVMLGVWGIQSTPSLPSLPIPLWPGVVAPDRALSMG